MFNLNTGILPYFFIGRVENKNDPLNNGRVKVRCLGIHPEQDHNTDNQREQLDVVEDIDLPWAHCINGSYGKMHAIPEQGEWVFGFFADGRDCQHPFLLGTLYGMNTEEYGPRTPVPSSSSQDSDIPSNTPRNELSNTRTLTEAEVDQILGGESVVKARTLASNFLGRELSDDEWNNLLAATVAEASVNSPKEQAYIMGVILNRARSADYPDDITDVLNQSNQFQAVTGTSTNPSPSNQFVNPPRSQIASTVDGVNQYLSDAPKHWLNFTSNITEAYTEGTDIGFRDDVAESDNSRVVGGTVFGTVR